MHHWSFNRFTHGYLSVFWIDLNILFKFPQILNDIAHSCLTKLLNLYNPKKSTEIIFPDALSAGLNLSIEGIGLLQLQPLVEKPATRYLYCSLYTLLNPILKLPFSILDFNSSSVGLPVTLESH